MFDLIKKYRREFVYSSYLFLVFELLLTPGFTVDINMYWLTLVLGFLLLLSWLFHTYNQHGSRKVSSSSDVLMRINLKERLFTHIFLPILFYSSLGAFFFFSHNLYLNQIIVVVSVMMFFYLFLNIRTSYEKVFYVKKNTRVVYDFITITVFYLATSLVAHLRFPEIMSVALIALLSFLAFIYMLYLNNKLELDGLLVAVLATGVVSLVAFYIWGTNVFTTPAIISTVFYTVVALWHVRFSGSRSLDDYIPPVMYTLMTLILILSL
jgi:hypothetical protein